MWQDYNSPLLCIHILQYKIHVKKSCERNEARASLQHVEVLKGNNIPLLGTDALEISSCYVEREILWT